MSIIIKPTAFSKGSPATLTLSKAALAQHSTIAGDAYFSSQTNWKMVIFNYKSSTGSQRIAVKFDPSEASPVGVFLATQRAKGQFEIESIMIFDFDEGYTAIPASELDATAFNISFGAAATRGSITWDVPGSHLPSGSDGFIQGNYNHVWATSKSSVHGVQSGDYKFTFHIDNPVNEQSVGIVTNNDITYPDGSPGAAWASYTGMALISGNWNIHYNSAGGVALVPYSAGPVIIEMIKVGTTLTMKINSQVVYENTNDNIYPAYPAAGAMLGQINAAYFGFEQGLVHELLPYHHSTPGNTKVGFVWNGSPSGWTNAYPASYPIASGTTITRIGVRLFANSGSNVTNLRFQIRNSNSTAVLMETESKTLAGSFDEWVYFNLPSPFTVVDNKMVLLHKYDSIVAGNNTIGARGNTSYVNEFGNYQYAVKVYGGEGEVVQPVVSTGIPVAWTLGDGFISNVGTSGGLSDSGDPSRNGTHVYSKGAQLTSDFRLEYSVSKADLKFGGFFGFTGNSSLIGSSAGNGLTGIHWTSGAGYLQAINNRNYDTGTTDQDLNTFIMLSQLPDIFDIVVQRVGSTLSIFVEGNEVLYGTSTINAYPSVRLAGSTLSAASALAPFATDSVAWNVRPADHRYNIEGGVTGYTGPGINSYSKSTTAYNDFEMDFTFNNTDVNQYWAVGVSATTAEDGLTNFVGLQSNQNAGNFHVYISTGPVVSNLTLNSSNTAKIKRVGTHWTIYLNDVLVYENQSGLSQQMYPTVRVRGTVDSVKIA